MSELAVNTIVDASSGNTAQINGQTPSESNMQGRNRIINGDMRIWQRGTSFTAVNNAYTADRWITVNNPDISRSTDVPPGAGFEYSLLQTITTAAINRSIQQRIESANCYDLAGNRVTISAYVKVDANAISSGARITLRRANEVDDFSSSAPIQSFVFSDLTPDTWTYVTFTTNNPLPPEAINGLSVQFVLSGGADAVANSNMQITGVQLEAGSVATPFERRPFGTELGLCQRYLPAYTGGVEMLGYWDGANNAKIVAPFLVESRVAPSGVTTSGSFDIHAPGSGNPAATSIAFSRATTTSARLTCNVASGGLSSANGAALNSAEGKILFTGCEL